MINSLMISKTGMQAQQMQLDVISNNLANVSTNGFKRATAVFEDLMYQNLRQVGANTAEQAELPTGLQVLVHQIFEHGGGAFEAVGGRVGQVVRNHVQLGLSGPASGLGNPQRIDHGVLR